MKLAKIYESIIKFGLQNDPRTKKQINDEIKRAKKVYRKLKGADKRFYDKERFRHPYADTRMLYGNPKKDIKTIMVGIDIETSELLLADRLREKGLAIDLAMSHHPEGKALASLAEVMNLHRTTFSRFGIGETFAKPLVDERIAEVTRGLSSANHTRSVEAARLLDIPYMCVHTPADNHVTHYLQMIFNKKKPKKVRDILNILKTIPEYRTGIERCAGPILISGKETNPTGKIFIDMTGGTQGPKKGFARLSQAGVGTIVGMHFGETHFKNAKAEHINLVIAGHVTSDNLGLNLLLDNLEKEEEINIISCSGFERIKRK